MTIAHNHLNLPRLFTWTGGGFQGNSVEILYDAAGTKLRKTVKTGATVNYVQDYIGGIEYRDNVREAIYTAEGRVFHTSPTTTRYEYTIKDHLGNARLSFSDLNGNGAVDVTAAAGTNELLQENHYYPFGLGHDGPWVNDAARDNRYQYNGKEWNDDFGLNWNDYGARWYDAAVGRWLSPDPMADEYTSWSPYNYVINNPLVFINPFGLSIRNAHDEELDEANIAYQKALNAKNNYSGNKKSEIRKLNREVNRAKDKLDITQSKFDAVNQMMTDLAAYNPDEYTQLDNLKDESGANTDVYVSSVEDLNSNDIPGSDFFTNVKLDGATDANGALIIESNHATCEVTKNYSSRSSFGLYTAAIYVEHRLNGKSKGRVFAHEGGHVLYQVKNMSRYLDYQKTSDYQAGGHGRGDKSGQEADLQEAIYNKNANK